MNILGLLGGGGNNIMLQAFGAMMQGQKPEQFLQNLARNNPQLSGIDFSNLQKSAENLCKYKGVDTLRSYMVQVRQIISEIYHEASADEKAVIKESIEKMRLMS